MIGRNLWFETQIVFVSGSILGPKLVIEYGWAGSIFARCLYLWHAFLPGDWTIMSSTKALSGVPAMLGVYWADKELPMPAAISFGWTMTECEAASLKQIRMWIYIDDNSMAMTTRPESMKRRAHSNRLSSFAFWITEALTLTSPNTLVSGLVWAIKVYR